MNRLPWYENHRQRSNNRQGFGLGHVSQGPEAHNPEYKSGQHCLADIRFSNNTCAGRYRLRIGNNSVVGLASTLRPGNDPDRQLSMGSVGSGPGAVRRVGN